MPDDPTEGAVPRRAPTPETVDGTADTIAAARAAVFSGTMRLECVAGRYEVLGLVGSGGMGSVYRARDRQLDEVVALKVLRRDRLGDPEALERFKREVKLARRVTHVNVARTFDIGEHEGEPFLTMEYIEGEPLSALLEREGALPPARVLAIAQALCAGLEAAHAAGVVHRDLKPDNVVVASDGRVVITDFGIAVTRRESTTGTVVGTPAYMAPEQVEAGKPVDARADVYALGALLYEMYTGERAWPGEVPVAVAAARLVAAPPDPRVRRPEVPAPLAAVVIKAMARLPGARFDSAAALAEALVAAHAATPRWPTLGPGAGGEQLAALRDAHAPRSDKTVAVLPFENVGPAEDAYVADGLTEEIIDTLSTTRGLRVRAPGVVMPWKGRRGDPRELGRKLEVQVVVEGSVRRVGESVQVRARASSVDDGFQLWAQRFDRPGGELLVVGDEVARAIAAALTVDIAAVPREPASDARVVDLYLQARARMNRGWRDFYEESAHLLEQALAIAPHDPHLLAAYAIVRTRLWFVEGDAGVTSARLARAAADEAVTYAPHLGEAQLALAWVGLNEGEIASAVHAACRATALAPGLAEAHALVGRILVEVGPVAEGIERCQLALALDPYLRTVRVDLARAHALLGEWDLAEAALRDLVEAEGEPAQFARARGLLWRRDADGARQALQKLEGNGFQVMVAGAILSYVAGIGPPPHHHSEHYSALAGGYGSRRRRAYFLQIAAELHAFEGDTDGTLTVMHDAVDAGLVDINWVDRCPLLEPMRNHDRFTALRTIVASRAAQVLAAMSCGPPGSTTSSC
jgi:serine/threonine-protein kinase